MKTYIVEVSHVVTEARSVKYEVRSTSMDNAKEHAHNLADSDGLQWVEVDTVLDVETGEKRNYWEEWIGLEEETQ
jgi:uncharacterized protein YggE